MEKTEDYMETGPCGRYGHIGISEVGYVLGPKP